ncbi:DNA-binding protein [Brevibacillus panacihumi W25]|uniref:DNA-binding protein n=1 Tax=Brevibacillus panacihumi W25 TaxID=1408254 RepID=V6MCW8_9BACL|nr:helix-turn-helix transcriptional regulator [Brevibacillus panacihumi]EST55750.1 DNA-binding protein [Brevibacillus panacihumi W25]
MGKKLGQDFQALKASAREIPGVREYLHSFPAIIADLVMSRRIQMRLTQEELAKLAGSTQATISRIESGDEGVKSGTLTNVFKALGIIGISPQFDEEAAAIHSK